MHFALTRDFRSLRRFSHRLSSRNLAVRVFNLASSARSAAVGRCIFGVRSDCSIPGAVTTTDARKSSVLWVAEPFRIFFPLGLLLGAIGVALWPLFVWHAIAFYPAQAHVRLMIEGLMGSFIIGFLGDCWSAPAGCVTAARRRNLCARCAPNRERFSASHTKTNNRGHRLSRIALVVSRHDGEASASATTICRRRSSCSFSSGCLTHSPEYF